MMELGQATLEEAEIDSTLVVRANGLGRSVVVLPVRSADGRGIYTESSLLIVKQLRAAGIDAAFLDPQDRRVFEVKKSALAVGIVTYILGIGSAASWDALKAILRSRQTKQISVTYVDLEGDDGSRATAWKVDGDSAAVIEAIDKLRGDGG